MKEIINYDILYTSNDNEYELLVVARDNGKRVVKNVVIDSRNLMSLFKLFNDCLPSSVEWLVNSLERTMEDYN